MYAIESDIPLPTEAAGKYPLGQLEVGQSFLVPLSPTAGEALDKDEVTATRRSVGVSMGAYTKRNPATKFEAHTVENGVRVWRTA